MAMAINHRHVGSRFVSMKDEKVDLLDCSQRTEKRKQKIALPRSPDGRFDDGRGIGDGQQAAVGVESGVRFRMARRAVSRAMICGAGGQRSRRQRHSVRFGRRNAGRRTGRRRVPVRGGRGRVHRQRSGFFHFVQTVAQMRHQFGAQIDVDSRRRGQTARHFGRAMRESGPKSVRVRNRTVRAVLAAKFVQMLYREFQNIRFLQFAHVLAFRLQRR